MSNKWSISTFPCTGKSLSGTLIFASTNPQYDDRLFIELQVQYMKIPSSNLGRTCCVRKLFLNFCTQLVLPMFYKKKSFWQRFTCTYQFVKWLIILKVLKKLVKTHMCNNKKAPWKNPMSINKGRSNVLGAIKERNLQ